MANGKFAVHAPFVTLSVALSIPAASHVATHLVPFVKNMKSPNHQPYSPGFRDECVSIFRSNVPRFFRDHELPEFTDFIDSLQCPYYVVLHEGRVVGCGGYGVRQGSSDADLCWGMVHRSCHGNRIGEYLLLVRLHAIVTATDCAAVRLGTSQHTEGFFRQYGFAIQSVQNGGIDRDLDHVEMRLDLSDKAKAKIISHWNEINQ